MITATPQWKPPILQVPTNIGGGQGTVRRPAGVVEFRPEIEQWLVDRGFAQYADDKQVVSDNPDGESSDEKPNDQPKDQLKDEQLDSTASTGNGEETSGQDSTKTPSDSATAETGEALEDGAEVDPSTKTRKRRATAQ